MSSAKSRQTYDDHVGRLRKELGEEEAVRAAVGGQFAAVGLLEYYLLLSLGLSERHHVIDVGCGSGRLACRLATIRELRYLGTDIVQDLLDSARTLANRSDWSFRLTNGVKIPCDDQSADFVCFFSVFTHLSHEDSFRYLAEAKRVLRPGGKIVFSFLEFRIPCHWDVFEDSLSHSGHDLHLNQFLDREGIQVWAQKLGLVVDFIADGDRPHIPIREKIVLENGHAMEGLGNLGQSVAVLRVPPRELRADLVRTAATPQTPEDGKTIPNTAGRFVSISTRGYVGAGNKVMIVGFVIRSGDKIVMARAIGPGLAPFAIPNFLRQPKIEVIDSFGRSLASNAGLGTAAETQRIEVILGTKLLNAQVVSDSDAALVVSLPPGAYSLVVQGHDEQSGLVLAEVYELPALPSILAHDSALRSP